MKLSRSFLRPQRFQETTSKSSNPPRTEAGVSSAPGICKTCRFFPALMEFPWYFLDARLKTYIGMEEVTYTLPFPLPLTPLRLQGHGWCFDASRTWCRHTPVAALKGVHLSFPVLFWASTKADRRSEKCFDAVIGEMEAEDYISMGWWLGVWGRRWCGGSLAEGLAEHGFCCHIPQFVCFFLLKDSFCWSTIITYFSMIFFFFSSLSGMIQIDSPQVTRPLLVVRCPLISSFGRMKSWVNFKDFKVQWGRLDSDWCNMTVFSECNWNMDSHIATKKNRRAWRGDELMKWEWICIQYESVWCMIYFLALRSDQEMTT